MRTKPLIHTIVLCLVVILLITCWCRVASIGSSVRILPRRSSQVLPQSSDSSSESSSYDSQTSQTWVSRAKQNLSTGAIRGAQLTMIPSYTATFVGKAPSKVVEMISGPIEKGARSITFRATSTKEDPKYKDYKSSSWARRKAVDPTNWPSGYIAPVGWKPPLYPVQSKLSHLAAIPGATAAVSITGAGALIGGGVNLITNGYALGKKVNPDIQKIVDKPKTLKGIFHKLYEKWEEPFRPI